MTTIQKLKLGLGGIILILFLVSGSYYVGRYSKADFDYKQHCEDLEPKIIRARDLLIKDIKLRSDIKKELKIQQEEVLDNCRTNHKP